MRFYPRAAELIGYNDDIRWDYSLLAGFVDPSTGRQKTEWIKLGIWRAGDQQLENKKEDRDKHDLIRSEPIEDSKVNQFEN